MITTFISLNVLAAHSVWHVMRWQITELGTDGSASGVNSAAECAPLENLLVEICERIFFKETFNTVYLYSFRMSRDDDLLVGCELQRNFSDQHK